MSYNPSTRHLSGQQKYVVDKKINDEKKRKADADRKSKESTQSKQKQVDVKGVSYDIFQEIHDALDEFIKQNPNATPEVVLKSETLEEIKSISPSTTYASGNSTTIFNKSFVVEDQEEKFIVRKRIDK